jgi:hypothetical protein
MNSAMKIASPPTGTPLAPFAPFEERHPRRTPQEHHAGVLPLTTYQTREREGESRRTPPARGFARARAREPAMRRDTPTARPPTPRTLHTRLTPHAPHQRDTQATPEIQACRPTQAAPTPPPEIQAWAKPSAQPSRKPAHTPPHHPPPSLPNTNPSPSLARAEENRSPSRLARVGPAPAPQAVRAVGNALADLLVAEFWRRREPANRAVADATVATRFGNGPSPARAGARVSSRPPARRSIAARLRARKLVPFFLESPPMSRAGEAMRKGT